MPAQAWHDSKKIHDFDARQCLSRAGGNFPDWEVIALFYSALHYVDSFLAGQYGIDPEDHSDREDHIMTLIQIIEKNYRLLHHLSEDARYYQVLIRQKELAKAQSYYKDIEFRLTPVECSSCGERNLLNLGKCNACGSII
jgi:hypothetical protein